MIQLTQLFMMSFVNKYGLVQAAAYGIGDKIIHLLNVFTQSVQQAGGAMAGQNIGAGRQDRVTKLIKTALAMTFSIVGLISVLSLVFPKVLFGLFTKDPEVLKYGFSFTMITALTLLLSSIMGSFSAVTTGTGRAGLSFLAGVLDGVIFRVAFSFILGVWLNMEVTGFFLANSLARLGPIIVHCSYYFSGAWKKVRRLTDIKGET
jgi:Na+-driven multidrug efflux pump